MSVVANVVDGVTEAPKKVLALWQKPGFWVAAAVVVIILAVIFLYVERARSYALAKLTAHAITSGAPAAAPTADQPAQPEPVKLAAA